MATKTAIATEPSRRVRWAGNPSPNCSPGTIGTILKVAYHDPNSIKVLWDDRPAWLGSYTWERAKNLTIIE